VTTPTVIRWTGEPGLDALLAAYHLATEAEKGTPVADVAGLPPRYRAEVRSPATAFADAAVFTAVLDRTTPPVGCVVVTPDFELKRLWVAESTRGRGVAAALMTAALDHAGAANVRLSVWRWRTDALALYTRLGFAEVESWDDRRDLVCLRRCV
jgi:putative acetyltransferase